MLIRMVILKQFFLLALALFLALPAFAQIGDPETNGAQILDVDDDGDDNIFASQGILHLDENCQAVFLLKVFVANQAFNLQTPQDEVEIGQAQASKTQESQFAAPNKMFLQYQIGANNQGFIEVGQFSYFGTYSMRPIFVWTQEVTIDLAPECQQGVEQVTYWAALRTHVPTEFFPIHDRSAPNDIFSCEIFQSTCHDCASPPAWCNASMGGDPIFSRDISIVCGGCYEPEVYITPTSEDGRDEQGIDGEKEVSLFSQQSALPKKVAPNAKLQLSPNPFDQQLNLNLDLAVDMPITLVVYDISGKVWYRQDRLSTNGTNSQRIATDTWPTGIYFIQTQIGQVVQTQRLSKIKTP